VQRILVVLRGGCATFLVFVGLVMLPSSVLADCEEVSVIAQLWRTPKPEHSADIGYYEAEKGTLEPRDAITVRLAPVKLLDKCLDGKLEPTLFIDHLPMTSLPTTGRFVVEKDGKKFVSLSFRLEKPLKGEAAWNELLYRDWIAKTQRRVAVGIGISGAEILTLAEPIRLSIGKGSPSWAWLALGLSGVAILVVAFASRALEDDRIGYKSFSLSRMVLTCWVATATAVVVVVWQHSQALPSFSDGGLPFMLAASGLGTGFSTWLDTRRRMENEKSTGLLEDLLCDEDGLALHRVQSLIFNVVVLYVVWADLIAYGTVAQVGTNWSALLGASTITYLFGRGAEDVATPVDPEKRPLPPLQNLSSAVRDKLKALTTPT
jgi:hypothetical protein